MTRVLVLGGSGALGSALLRELHAARVPSVFTCHLGGERAQAISAELDYRCYTADFTHADAIARLFAALERDGCLPDVVVHCAGIAPIATVGEVGAADWDAVHAVHGRAAMLCAQEMERRALRGALVLVAALDGIAPVPAPAHYAASQAALWGLTLALAKELGPKGILVNLALVGVLEGGIASELDPKLRDSYRRYAALGRTGTCAEAARGLRWLALENTYLNGAQFPLTGGLG